MSISVEAAAARDSLSNDKELIHTYEVDFFFFDLSINTLIGCPMVIPYLSDFSASSLLR